MDIRGFSVSPTEPTQGQNSGPRTGPVEPLTELSPVQSKNSLGDSPKGPTYSFDQIRSSRTLANDSQMSYHTLLKGQMVQTGQITPLCAIPLTYLRIPIPGMERRTFPGPTSCSRRIIWIIWLALQPLQAIQWHRDVHTHCQVRFQRRWVPCRFI